MKTLIKNSRVVTAVDDYKADILIEDERVSVIGANLQMEADKTIDAGGKLVIPGGIDPHTHVERPFGGPESSDDFRTGTKVIGRLGAAEWPLHVRVRIDSAGDDKFAAGVDRLVGLHLEISADDGDALIFDQDVGFVIIDCR